MKHALCCDFPAFEPPLACGGGAVAAGVEVHGDTREVYILPTSPIGYLPASLRMGLRRFIGLRRLSFKRDSRFVFALDLW